MNVGKQYNVTTAGNVLWYRIVANEFIFASLYVVFMNTISTQKRFDYEFQRAAFSYRTGSINIHGVTVRSRTVCLGVHMYV